MITSNSLEKKRPIFFFTGLIIALGFAIGSLEYSVPIASVGPWAPDTLIAEIDIDEPIITFAPEREKPKVKVNEKLAPIPVPDPEPLPDPKPDPVPRPDSIIDISELDTIVEIEPVDVVESLDMRVIQHKPVFPGCENLSTDEERYQCLQLEIQKFIARNTEYPQHLKDIGVYGRSYVQFTINEFGDVINVEPVEGRVDPGLDKAAAKAVSKLPKFTPGKHNGLPARTRFIIPVNFKIQ
jgi:protein TonB